jgi:hypothetical protein
MRDADKLHLEQVAALQVSHEEEMKHKEELLNEQIRYVQHYAIVELEKAESARRILLEERDEAREEVDLFRTLGSDTGVQQHMTDLLQQHKGARTRAQLVEETVC